MILVVCLWYVYAVLSKSCRSGIGFGLDHSRSCVLVGSQYRPLEKYVEIELCVASGGKGVVHSDAHGRTDSTMQ